MKKTKLKPLELDKKTAARLCEKQIDVIIGGKRGDWMMLMSRAVASNRVV